jgi:hypothetical protein
MAPEDILLVIRGLGQRKNSWDYKQQMAALDTLFKGYAFGPIYLIELTSKLEEHVFDGAHRVETLVDFYENKFPIKKADSSIIKWETSILREHEGKYFRDLPGNMKFQLRNYQYQVSKIPETLAENPEELAMLWVRVNNSGNPLNDYEAYIPVYGCLYDFLEGESDRWYGTLVYPKKESLRGELNVKLMRLLAASETSYPTAFSGQTDFYKNWRNNTFGKTTEIAYNLANKKVYISEHLNYLFAVYKFLIDREVILDGANEIILLMIIGRIAVHCPKRIDLTRCEKLIVDFTKCMFRTDVTDHLKRHGRTSANGAYQKAILAEIDSAIRDIAITYSIDDRRFSPVQQRLVLAKQNNICTYCNNLIKPDHNFEGHHIKFYRDGGSTTIDNLAVLHDFCHKAIHAK